MHTEVWRACLALVQTFTVRSSSQRRRFQEPFVRASLLSSALSEKVEAREKNQPEGEWGIASTGQPRMAPRRRGRPCSKKLPVVISIG